MRFLTPFILFGVFVIPYFDLLDYMYRGIFWFSFLAFFKIPPYILEIKRQVNFWFLTLNPNKYKQYSIKFLFKFEKRPPILTKNLTNKYNLAFFTRLRLVLLDATKLILVNRFKLAHQSIKLILLFFVKTSWLFRINPLKFKWRPLFKKSSYFGFYRTMFNQILNK